MTGRRPGDSAPALAHYRNYDSTSWVSLSMLGVAHHAWCADVAAQAVLEDTIAQRRQDTPSKQAKARRPDVLAVLGALVLRADCATRTADLTYRQLEVATGLSRHRVSTAVSVALSAGLIVSVTKALAPIEGRAGRAPQRRLDYLDPYVRQVVPAYRHDLREESCREPAGIVPVSRNGLIDPLTNNAADEANKDGRTWANRLSINVTGHLAGKQRSKPAQVRTQYGSRIRLAIDRLEDDLSPLASDDHDLVAYVADTVVDGRGNPASRRRLAERAECLRGRS